MIEQVLQFLAAEPGWLWLILAVILGILDVLAPGFFMLWFGVAAAAVGLTVFAMPGLDTHWQILIFCGISVAALLTARTLWGGTRPDKSDSPLLNQRAQQLVGRTFTLASPIRGGYGRVLAGDGMWSVRGPEMAEGTQVTVTGTEGTVLIVEAAGADGAGKH